MSSKFEFYKTLVLSTAHLTESIAQDRFENMENSSFFTKSEYGYRLYCGVESIENDVTDVQLMWAGLSHIWKKAKELGCRYVEFDCDATIYDDFPEYEW